jgi:hypothetical protein
VLTFRSTTLADGYPVTLRVDVSTEAMGDPAVEGVVQKFADLVHATPDFNLTSGSRMTSYTETITAGPVT